MPVKSSDLDVVVRQLADFVDAVAAEARRLSDRMQALADFAYQSHRRSEAAQQFRDELTAELANVDALDVAAQALRVTLYGLTGAATVPPNPQRRPYPAGQLRHVTGPDDPSR